MYLVRQPKLCYFSIHTPAVKKHFISHLCRKPHTLIHIANWLVFSVTTRGASDGLSAKLCDGWSWSYSNDSKDIDYSLALEGKWMWAILLKHKWATSSYNAKLETTTNDHILKRIFQEKMKTLIIYSPSTVPNPYDAMFSMEYKCRNICTFFMLLRPGVVKKQQKSQ